MEGEENKCPECEAPSACDECHGCAGHCKCNAEGGNEGAKEEEPVAEEAA